MNTRDTVLVLDFGGQYNQLIARRIRDLKVYCELVPCTLSASDIKKRNPIGLIFTGGPLSAFSSSSPKLDPGIFALGIPVLGICYGMQVSAHLLGGEVTSAPSGEYGRVGINYLTHPLFKGISAENICWMSHTDYVSKLPQGFSSIAHTDKVNNAAMANDTLKVYGLQFHPEVVHTQEGLEIIKNFLFGICGAKGDWDMSNFAEKQVKELTEKLKNKKVLLALSGGVDSSVCAALLSKAAGKNLICVFVDHGLLRKGEAEQVKKVFGEQFGINLIAVDAEKRFLEKLKGVTDPEKKRKIIGAEFIKVFEEEAKKIGKVDFLAQGTIYPDVVESGINGSAVIKSHHNVGGLPSVVDFEDIIEPLRCLFKDEVRKVGYELGLPKHIVMRQPFPGPGLGIRVIGEVTKEKLDILRDADYIYREEIAKAGLEYDIWQYFAVITDMKSVGVMGDHRTYDYTLALRAVNSVDAMSADWYKVPYDVLEKCSTRIVNEVKYINRIVYDITSKPPATIEWE
jgi:GMP synthase (glutamine-hydrolysing)